MKKLFLIPLMALMCSVTAWAVGVSDLTGLQAAVANGGEITLTDNINVNQQIEIMPGKTVVLDLNGHTIAYTSSTTLSSGVLLVHNGASLTINDSSNPQIGEINSGIHAYAAIALTKAGDDATNPAVLVVNGGKLFGYYYAIVGNGSRHNTYIEINGGYITGTCQGDNQGIYHPQNGTLIVNGGTIEAYSAAIEIRAGELEINGGSFTALAPDYHCEANASGTTTTGAAIAIEQHTTKKDIEVTINGGVFTGAVAIDESNPQGNYPAPAITMAITDGTFNAAITTDDVHNFVSGGEFATEVPADQCAEGFNPATEKNAQGKYEVVQVSVAKIGTTYYASLPAAVAAATNDQTVQLIGNVAAGPGVMIAKADAKQITIDLGGFTYCATSPGVGSTNTQNQALHFEKGCDITLQNGTITSSGSTILMLVQNYGDLHLINVTLDGTGLPYSHAYVLSNNCGDVVIDNGTTITAKDGDVAFDVCATNYYPDGTTVTVKEGAVINGIVEYDVWGTKPADNKAELAIEGGELNITWNVEAALAEDAKENLNVSGGSFSSAVPADYCAEGYEPAPQDPQTGKYTVKEVEYTTVRENLTAGRYYTMCLKKAVTNVKGATIWRILGKADESVNPDIVLEEVEMSLVAGRPYIFNATADKLEVAYTGDEVANPIADNDNNGLVGTFEEIELEANPNTYVIYNNALYYVAGSGVIVDPYRAYINMNEVPAPNQSAPVQGRRQAHMSVNSANSTTALENAEVSEAPRKVLINGQLFILRDGKMIDATGRVVK